MRKHQLTQPSCLKNGLVNLILRLIIPIMSDEEQAQWPTWKRAVYQVDYSESEYPSVTDRLLAASVKNNRGGTSWRSWESPDEPAAGKRTLTEEDPDVPDSGPDSKKTKIKMSDFTDDQVNKLGNAAKEMLKLSRKRLRARFALTQPSRQCG